MYIDYLYYTLYLVLFLQVPSSGGVGGQNVVIRQNGLRPGQPGTSITVPLSTLQALQAGQGIPTGQPGHLLVRTETGQYQILRVGPQPSSTQGVVPVATSNVAQHHQQQPTVVRTASTIGAPGPTSMGPGSPMIVRQNGPGPGPQIVRTMNNTIGGVSGGMISGVGMGGGGNVTSNTVVRNTLASAPNSMSQPSPGPGPLPGPGPTSQASRYKMRITFTL